MKIKEILIESFRSPFYNLLAIANLTMAAIVGSFQLARGYNDLAALVHDLNGPAIAASILLTGSFKMTLLIPPFIYLQWILIGAFAKFVGLHTKSATDHMP
jgi:hypothetical protein